MKEEKTNILIISQSACAQALARKLSQYEECGKIFVAPASEITSDLYESVDIRADDLTALLKFVLENDIKLTIPISETALKSDIASFFHANGQNIFAPTALACEHVINKIKGKHFLYKIHAQTAKFGVFDKLQSAQDWLEKSNFPITIKCSENIKSVQDKLVCPTATFANKFLDELFSKGENAVLLEEYTFGHNFTIYFVTDGYSALPITSVGNYKFEQDGDGGIYTNGMGCYTPDYKISETVISRVSNVVKNMLEYLDRKNTPYLGILGVECTLTGEDKFYVNEFKPFFEDFDATAVLNSIDENLIEIFNACIHGLFADEYEQIKTNETSSVSAVLTSKYNNITIEGIENIEGNIDIISVKTSLDGKFLTTKNPTFVITQNSSNLFRAKKLLSEDISLITFEGKHYRKDILKDINY